jgi:hypothetical protein
MTNLKEFLTERFNKEYPIEDLLENDPEYQKAIFRISALSDKVKDIDLNTEMFTVISEMAKCHANAAYLQGLKDGYELETLMADVKYRRNKEIKDIKPIDGEDQEGFDYKYDQFIYELLESHSDIILTPSYEKDRETVNKAAEDLKAIIPECLKTQFIKLFNYYCDCDTGLDATFERLLGEAMFKDGFKMREALMG